MTMGKVLKQNWKNYYKISPLHSSRNTGFTPVEMTLVSILVLSLFSFAYATEIYVYPQTQEQENSDSEINTLSVTVMYPNIQAAIDAAVDGDIIYLAKGRYKGDGNRDLDFGGKAITLSGLRPEDANYVSATILDCNGTETENHRGFYFHSGEDNNSIVCGITITNAYHNYYGSAVYCTKSSPIIHHCDIVSNYGNNSAIYLSGGSSILADCTIADNNATSAIYAYGTSSNCIQIVNCTIKNNTSISTCYGIYGGEYINILNCRIEYNKSRGIHLRGSTSVNISGCLIRGNGTNKSDTGGLYGRCYIKNSSIIENIGAGITYGYEVRNCFIGHNTGNGVSSCTKVVNSKIIGNGGIGISSPSNVSNCIVAKNKNQGIGYIYGKPIISNCTIVDNNMAGIDITSVTALKITNCIVRDNYLEQIKNVTSATTIAYTNSYKSDTTYGYPRYIPYTGTGNINEEPNFVSENDYHLSAGSPCIDAGTNDANYVTEANDIDGSERIIDGDSNGITTADMGAYEYNTNWPVIAVWADRLVCLTNAGNEVKGKIYVKNAGAGTLNYEITSDNDWLTINNPIGTSSGEISEVNVSIDANSLELGDYHCRIKVYSDEAVNSVQEYWLNVHIGNLWTVPVDVNTIQAAIDAAGNYDYVRVMDGNYTGEGNRNITFGGKNIILYSDSGNPENCVIDCGYDYGFKLISRETEASINGFSIMNCSTGVVCDACSSPEISNCIFNYGTAFCLNNYSSIKIEKSDFYNGYGFASTRFNKIDIDNCEFNKLYRGTNISNGDKFILRNSNLIDFKYEGLYMTNVKNVKIDGCCINGISGGGINLTMIGDVKILNSEIKRNKSDGIHLMQFVRGEISNCDIINNGRNSKYYGMSLYPLGSYSNFVIRNCLITGNGTGCYVVGNSSSMINFENCTFDGNRSYLLYRSSSPEIIFENCIIWDPNLIYQRGSSSTSVEISYCDVRGGYDGVGNINEDPRFVDAGYWDANGTSSTTADDFWVDGDYRLMSEGWRLDSDTNEWVYDELTSRCIDAGSPGYPLGDEATTLPDDPENEYGENLRIDMGCYGGTAEASMPPYDWALLSDIDNSGRVNLADFSYLSSFYGLQGEKLDGDLNRDGIIDFEDVVRLTEEWLMHTDWAPRR